ncbi:hypothetical protein D9758_005153 [Tetrapyrgos nigripes]|uniref:Uncharacterized protein n=1 Tax=Tetrapyrgos nigripes TaxID=182062 RepID=A0A8H5LWW0_9AGAR|nr:hypothetical protein D9758_005153 [Tetrapyrgos nigripes]
MLLLSILPPDGTCLTPAVVLDVRYHLWIAVKQAVEDSEELKSSSKQGGNSSRVTKNAHISVLFLSYSGKVYKEVITNEQLQRMTQYAFLRFVVELGCAVYNRESQPHTTFLYFRQLQVPGRASPFASTTRDNQSVNDLVVQAARLLQLFAERGVPGNKIIISIPSATEAGVAAARRLRMNHGIQTNLIMVSNVLQAAACADARASVVSVDVGNQSSPQMSREVQIMSRYIRQFHTDTQIAGSNFRSLSDVTSLYEHLDTVFLNIGDEEKLIVPILIPPTPSLTPSSTPTARSGVVQSQKEEVHDYTAKGSQSKEILKDDIQLEVEKIAQLLRFYKSRRSVGASANSDGLRDGYGFMDVMPASARSILAGALGSALERMQRDIGASAAIIQEEVLKQYALATCDVLELVTRKRREQERLLKRMSRKTETLPEDSQSGDTGGQGQPSLTSSRLP